ncbi:MAG: hypothetical protein ABGY43_00385, partial [bacterium]
TTQANRLAEGNSRPPWPSGICNITRRNVAKTTDLTISVSKKRIIAKETKENAESIYAEEG